MGSNNKIKFDILLSTYNGGSYIAEQLDSLIQQKEFIEKIYIRDDGSSDETIVILNKYCLTFPELIEIVFDGKGNLGPKNSFLSLTTYSTADFIAFCDQDDVWDRNKLSNISNFYSNKLQHFNPKLHAFVIHSDLKVVDAELNVLNQSFCRSLNIDGHESNVGAVLVRNTVTGCAMVLSRRLLELGKIGHDSFKLHDHWFACLAAMNEGIYFIDKQLVLYRQHGKNCVGAPKGLSIKKIINLIDRNVFSKLLYVANNFFSFNWDICKKRAESLIFLLGTKLKSNDKMSLELLICLSKSTPVARFIKIFKMALMRDPQLCFINKIKYKFLSCS